MSSRILLLFLSPHLFWILCLLWTVPIYIETFQKIFLHLIARLILNVTISLYIRHTWADIVDICHTHYHHTSSPAPLPSQVVLWFRATFRSSKYLSWEVIWACCTLIYLCWPPSACWHSSWLDIVCNVFGSIFGASIGWTLTCLCLIVKSKFFTLFHLLMIFFFMKRLLVG